SSSWLRSAPVVGPSRGDARVSPSGFRARAWVRLPPVRPLGLPRLLATARSREGRLEIEPGSECHYQSAFFSGSVWQQHALLTTITLLPKALSSHSVPVLD